MHQLTWVGSVLGVALTVCALTGCGGGGGDFRTEKVTGRVVWQGQPVEGASVQFIPQAGQQGGLAGKAALGKTDAEGRFTLSTYQSGDGAVVGTHKVLVGMEDPERTLPGKLPEGFTLEVKKGGGEFEISLN